MQRDTTIDCLKGVAIFFVLLEHSISKQELDNIYSWFYIGQAVPLFFAISAFLTTAKYTTLSQYFNKNTFGKLFNRIVKPFLFIQLFSLVILFLANRIDLRTLYLAGGFGPGSYYPFVYVQAWVILPFIILLIDKFRFVKATIVIIIICIVCESVYIFYNQNYFPYRLFVGRYIFILYLGCLAQKKMIPKYFFYFATISIFLVIGEFHNKFTDSFVVYNTDWKGYHWWAYFYTLTFASFFIFILRNLKNALVRIRLNILGKASYEIYIVQMFLFGFFRINNFEDLFDFQIPDHLYSIAETSIFIFDIVTSICIGLWYKSLKN